jgi:hypothetical protein
VWASIAQFPTKTTLMPCAALTSMLTLKITNLSSCVVATILEGASCYILAPLFFFLSSRALLCHSLYLT